MPWKTYELGEALERARVPPEDQIELLSWWVTEVTDRGLIASGGRVLHATNQYYWVLLPCGYVVKVFQTPHDETQDPVIDWDILVDSVIHSLDFLRP